MVPALSTFVLNQRTQGWSLRWIAERLGVSLGTVAGDVQVFNSEHLPPTVTGADGKTYPAPWTSADEGWRFLPKAQRLAEAAITADAAPVRATTRVGAVFMVYGAGGHRPGAEARWRRRYCTGKDTCVEWEPQHSAPV